MALNFDNCKKERLSGLDLSRKGSIDEGIVDLTRWINDLDCYFSTSSCSGRIIVVENESSGPKKKGCQWKYTTHDKAVPEEVMTALSTVDGNLVFKFEPFIMHIQCRSLQDAQSMHCAAVASGFRNSGITVSSKGKIMAAIRSSHGLEVPLSKEGELLVSEQYLTFLVEMANKKLEENSIKIERFFEEIKQLKKEPTSRKGVRNPKSSRSIDKGCKGKPKQALSNLEEVFNSGLALFENENG